MCKCGMNSRLVRPNVQAIMRQILVHGDAYKARTYEEFL